MRRPVVVSVVMAATGFMAMADDKRPLQLYLDLGVHASTFNGATPDPNAEDPGLFEEPVPSVQLQFIQVFLDPNEPDKYPTFSGGILFGGVNLEEGTGLTSATDEIIRNAKSLRLDLEWNYQWASAGRAYVGFYSGFAVLAYSPTENVEDDARTGDFVQERYVFPFGFRYYNDDALDGTFLQIGWGRSDRFEEEERWLGHAVVNLDATPKEGRWRGILDFSFNFDGSDGADELRVLAGLRYDVTSFFNKKKKTETENAAENEDATERKR